MAGHVSSVPQKPRLVTPRLAWLLTGSLLSLSSFFLLMTVAPLYASKSSGSSVDAGLVTGVMMLATVAIELVMPQLVARWGYRNVMIAGYLLLAIPSLVLVPFDQFGAIIAVAFARGIGFGIVVVGATALAAEFAAPGRRGETLGLYGVAVCVPSIFGLPLGVWLSENVGFTVVFVLAFLCALCALVAVGAYPNTRKPYVGTSGVAAAAARPAVLRPALIFTAAATATGVFMTFLPLAVSITDSGSVVVVALLAQTTLTSVFRWLAGRLSDRFGASRLLPPAVAAAAIGAACMYATGSAAMVIGGMCIFGMGFGMTQNLTLTMMLDRTDAGGVGAVSALWNIGYDGGMGIGAVGFGYLAVVTGYPIGFAVLAGVLAVAVIPAFLRTKVPVVAQAEPEAVAGRAG
ncbi:MAG TPA: MFS transporter [Candidatus Stackebrandtia faecavium]|nr:MFS transporter [Candidatus Stackebrandtia faecavium]